ncbi:MAG: trypsin-like peptidase domain-containing protein [Rhodanobacter sp.]
MFDERNMVGRHFHWRAWGVWLACVTLLGFTTIGAAEAASLDPAVLPQIQAATFEVVQAKPTVDPLTYEKPLPLDLLPYQERTDKYYSIGTAFSIGQNRYVTAGHVLLAGVGSLWGPPALRDSKGQVYAIDKIEQFSLRKDFVVFSLAAQPGTAALTLNPKPALNQVVYAVGNALGTGVVIRDGLYTSDTPEQQDGRWKWMRFSAAASPGNSGGPLLDKDGKVIGVVLMKSASENLNYALPISEVLNAPAHQAVIDARAPYRFDLFSTIQNGTFKAQFALPMSMTGFFATYMAQGRTYSEGQLKALLAKESANLFPNGNGSSRLLFHQTMLSSFPSLIARGSNGEWTHVGDASKHFTLEGNGYVDVGVVGSNGLVHLRRPDGVDATTFYGDAKTRMDLLAKTGMFQRAVAGEQIKITSLGKPADESVRMDRWQRPWRVETWSLPYANATFVVYSLPVPDGSVMLTRLVPVALKHDIQLDMNEYISFVQATYTGTLAQWKDFLKQSALLPAAFKNIHLDFDYGHRFSYTSQRVAFSYTPDVQPVAPENWLRLGFWIFMDKGQPVWDVGDVDLWKTATSDDADHININRYVAPPAGLDENISSLWQKVSGRQYPYNGVAGYDNDRMMIASVIAPVTTGGKPPTVLFAAFYNVAGTQPQAEMTRKLDLLTKDLRVIEH